jgi:hypothetical protein
MWEIDKYAQKDIDMVIRAMRVVQESSVEKVNGWMDGTGLLYAMSMRSRSRSRSRGKWIEYELHEASQHVQVDKSKSTQQVNYRSTAQQSTAQQSSGPAVRHTTSQAIKQSRGQTVKIKEKICIYH